MKRAIVFDLDGTLAESKSTMDAEMVSLLNDLLSKVKVAIISGGDWPQFEKQVLSRTLAEENLSALSLLPTCGTKFYRYESGWKKIYSEDLLTPEKVKIEAALQEAMRSLALIPSRVWGEIIEDRGSQITFSALGQEAPLEAKKSWDPDFVKRSEMQKILHHIIPEFSVRSGGTTSIDITRSGIDKAYGMRKLEEILAIPTSEMLFIGDAIFPGGNDYPVQEMGVDSILVRDAQETKRVIETILAILD